jgi:hypothetical protein
MVFAHEWEFMSKRIGKLEKFDGEIFEYKSGFCSGIADNNNYV